MSRQGWAMSKSVAFNLNCVVNFSHKKEASGTYTNNLFSNHITVFPCTHSPAQTCEFVQPGKQTRR